jgi:hypothetical protein
VIPPDEYAGDACVGDAFCDDAFVGDVFCDDVFVGDAFVGDVFFGDAFVGDAFVCLLVAFAEIVFWFLQSASRISSTAR